MSDLMLGLIIYASLTLLTWLLVLGNRRLNFWRKLGVSHSTSHLIFGNLLSHRSLAESFSKTFTEFKLTQEPFCGFFFLMEPAAFVLDKSLATKILLSDKQNFSRCKPYLVVMHMEVSNLLEASSQVFVELSKRLKGLEQPINVNNFCHKYISAVIALLYGGGIDDVPTTSSAALRKWSYALRILYGKRKDGEARKTAFFRSLAVHRDVAASLLSCVLLKLADNEELQEKLRAETCKGHEKFQNELVFESTLWEKELTAIFNEYAPYSHIILRTLKNYSTNVAGYTLEENRLVIIPVEAFAKYEKDFDMKTFNIGIAEMSLVKAALMFILNKYKFAVCKETPTNVEFDEILPHKVLKSKIYLQTKKL